MLRRGLPILLFFLLAVLPACTPAEKVLTVMTHDSFAISEEVIVAFEQEYHVDVVFLRSGDAGEALNKAILARQAPLADIFFGVDNTFLSRALEAGIFVPYSPAALDAIPQAFRLDPENQLLPVDYGDVCINYDRAWFAENALPVPGSLDDLLKPEYAGTLVVENPATSSPGLAFLLASIAVYGDPGYLDYWASLRDNGLVVVNDWSTAYYSNFSASSGRGPQPMVVSYASSPAAEVVYADPPVDTSPTASILAPGTCYRQIEFAGILTGTRELELAQEFIDYMLSVPFQEDIPLQMFMYPVNPEAQLPDAFEQWAQVSDAPAYIDPDTIAANRERWIAEWTEVVLR